MKKFLLLSIFTVISFCVFSQKIKLESGSLNFLKEETSIAATFTYNDMKVGKKTEADYVNEKVEKYNKSNPGKGDTWHKAWLNDRPERFEPKFIELFNKHMNEKNGATINENANYTVIINTYHTEPGFNVGVVRKNAEVSLKCLFINNTTNEEIALVTIEKASANNFWGDDFDTGYRIQETYAKAGRQLAKFFIKELKLK